MITRDKVKHMSFSGLMAYLSDRQGWYKCYVRWEFDPKTWLGTVIGTGVHLCAERYVQENMPMAKTAELYIADQKQQFAQYQIALNDKDIDADDPEAFAALVSEGIFRCIPVLKEHIDSNRENILQAEATYKLLIGKAYGMPEAMLPLKAKVDCITKDTIEDYKVVKTFTNDEKGEPIKYMLQGVGYALARAAHDGVKVPYVDFIEILRTPSYADKLAEYHAKLAAHEAAKANGEKSRKPVAPKQPEMEEERMRVIRVHIEQWKIQVFMELYQRVCREIMGESLIAQGLFLPATESKYEAYPDGWIDFCIEVLGYNPYTGEVPETKTLNVSKDIPDTINVVYDPVSLAKNMLEATKDMPSRAPVKISKEEFDSYTPMRLPPLQPTVIDKESILEARNTLVEHSRKALPLDTFFTNDTEVIAQVNGEETPNKESVEQETTSTPQLFF